MTTTYRVAADGIELVDQHAADPDGQISFGTDKDCGEACIVSTLRYIHGITAVTAEDIRRDLLRDNSESPTTPQQLSDYLANELNIANSIYTPRNQHDYLHYEWLYLDKGLPLIALRYWETIDSPYLHFCEVSEQTESTATVMDPWLVQFVTESYAAHYAMALGHATLIGIDRARDVS